MALHFDRDEYQSRISRTIASMEQQGLDGLLMFRQESMYYLTGYDTFGFCYFQCLYLGIDGRLMLVTRSPDLRQAQHTSIIEDIRIWVDRDGSDPAEDLRTALKDIGCGGKRLGVEYDAYGLTAANGKKLDAALEGFCRTEDASRIVSDLRIVKSPAEIAFVRRAAELADASLAAGEKAAGPGVDEGHILAAMQGAVFEGGGDYAGNEFIIGSGSDALLCRYFTGRKTLGARDQLTVEFAGAYRHYHACMMRTFLIGEPDNAHLLMYDAVAEALEASRTALKPGEPIGNVFDAHARTLDDAGYSHARLNACGYSLGAVFAPMWMDTPMLYHGNPTLAEPGMVFFMHMILMDSDADRAMTLGETVLVTDAGSERLSSASLDLVIRN